MKKALLLLFFIAIPAYSLTIDDLNEPRPFMDKFGTSENIKIQTQKEKSIVQTAITKNEPQKEEIYTDKTPVEEVKAQNYADLSLKRLSKDVGYELDIDSDKINADLNVLWSAALERSETMKYAIYKLSNPDEDKPKDGPIKKILKPIANISSVAGASVAGDPFIAAGALIGGGLANAFMKDDKEFNYTFSKVSDADMVLLVRKIDTLQKKLLDLYVDYKTKQEIAKMTEENCKNREKIYKNSQNKGKEEIIITDVFYRNAKLEAQRAHDDYMTSRAILENLVGLEALQKIES